MTTNSCDNRTPFEKFDDFTRQIMAVPKSEIDAKEAEWKAKQTTKKTKHAPKPK